MDTAAGKETQCGLAISNIHVVHGQCSFRPFCSRANRLAYSFFSHTHNRFTALLEYVRDHPGEQYQKGKTRKVKTNLDLLEQEIVSSSGICWAIRKSAPHPRQPRQYPTTQFFTGRMPFLPPNQQRQSTEACP